MRDKTCGIVIISLILTLGVFAAPAQGQTSKPNQGATRGAASAQQNVPAEYEEGIAQLRIAKGYLEKAGDKWGGYRVRGIASIDRAFKALGVSPESTPQEMESGNVDQPAMMNSGIASLQTAKEDFAKAGNNWGGRKARAVALIDQALQNLQSRN